MHVFTLFSALFALLSITSALPTNTTQAGTKRDFGPVVIFNPPSSYAVPRTLYGRSLMLNDGKGTLLSTWENYDGGPKPWFNIYRSTDHGFTWNPLSKVQDTVNGWGLRYQPQLYQLPQAVGSFAAGTILIAGNSIPSDLSKTQIDLYASTDNGATWTFVSHIAAGGKAVPNNGETPVWEPFLMVYNNQLVCYYSDQRDPSYGQKLVHVVSPDGGKTWNSPVNDVAVSPYSARPGMTTVSKLPNGNYIMTYEYGGGPENNGNFPVYYKIASNPLQFNSVTGKALRSTDGLVPSGSPYNIWTSVGGSNGAIVVSASSTTDLFVSKDLGNTWTRLTTATPDGYSKSLAVGFNPKDIVIVNGGVLNGQNNQVTLVARDVNGCSSCS